MVVGGPEGSKPPTIRDVARVAGVSKSAVARVLGGEGSVSPAMRQRVTKAAQDLGYRTNDLGRILATQRTMVIGLVIADITNSFYSVLADGVIKVAQRAGYRIMVVASNEEPGAERQSIELLCASRVAGIIAVPTGSNAELWQDAVRLVKHVVFIDRSVEGVDGVHVIRADSAGGAYSAVSHLTALGHTRIGALVGPLQVSTAAERLSGYRTALAEAGIEFDPNLVVSASYRRPHAEQAALELLDRTPTPTAVFASNNIHGEAMLMAARDSGLTIPDQLSLVMFDDLPWARLLTPPPTVVSQPTERLGREAAARVLRAIAGEDGSIGGVTSLPTRLIVRSSTAPLNGGAVPHAAVPTRPTPQEPAS